MPNCIILRGLPGSGKSSFAHQIGAWIVSEDEFFTKNGEYKFDKTMLVHAHGFCFVKFCDYIDQNRPDICVDNTNTTKKEYQRYVDYAKDHGYNVTILTVETDLTDEELAKRNVHGVPIETIKRMRERMRHG